jgi:trans-aconitate 2-methyltransferase
VCDHLNLLNKVERALCDGGVMRLNFAGDGNCSYFFKVIREAMEMTEFCKYFEKFEWPWYMPSVEAYKALVENSGFRNARVWGENADRFFTDTGAMIQWIDQPSLVPFLACVAAKDKDSFREFVVTRMIEETRQNDGRCFETFRRINVFAKK